MREMVFIDRQTELEVFSKALREISRSHIILLSGEGGMGKSSLLRLFARICAQNDVPHAHYTFRNVAGNPIEVMMHLSLQLNGSRFQRLKGELVDIGINLSGSTENEPIDSTDIQYALSGFDLEQRLPRLLALTNAFFADIRSFLSGVGSTAFLLDDFETAGPLTQDWLSGPFLTNVNATRGVVAVIAGRQVPEPAPDWHASKVSLSLGPIDDVDDWLNYAAQISAKLSSNQIKALVAALKGRPLEMATIMSQLASGIEDSK